MKRSIPGVLLIFKIPLDRARHANHIVQRGMAVLDGLPYVF